MELREVGWMLWTGFIYLRIRTTDEICEHGNDRSGSIKGAEFLD